MEAPRARGERLANAARLRVAGDLRLGRIAAGLSIRELSRASAVSPSRISRIERAMDPGVALEDLFVLLAIVGIDIRIATSPGATAHRDRAHAALLGRVQGLLHAGWTLSYEVPLPIQATREAGTAC